MIEIRQLARHDEIEIPPLGNFVRAQSFCRRISLPQDFRSGYGIDVPLIDTSRYLDYLAGRFREANGRIRTPVHLEQLDEVSDEFPLVV